MSTVPRQNVRPLYSTNNQMKVEMNYYRSVMFKKAIDMSNSRLELDRIAFILPILIGFASISDGDPGLDMIDALWKHLRQKQFGL